MNPLLAPAILAITLGGCTGIPGGPESALGNAGYTLTRGSDGSCRIEVASGRDLGNIDAAIDGKTCSVEIKAEQIDSQTVTVKALELATGVLQAGGVAP